MEEIFDIRRNVREISKQATNEMKLLQNKEARSLAEAEVFSNARCKLMGAINTCTLVINHIEKIIAGKKRNEHSHQPKIRRKKNIKNRRRASNKS